MMDTKKKEMMSERVPVIRRFAVNNANKRRRGASKAPLLVAKKQAIAIS